MSHVESQSPPPTATMDDQPLSSPAAQLLQELNASQPTASPSNITLPGLQPNPFTFSVAQDFAPTIPQSRDTPAIPGFSDFEAAAVNMSTNGRIPPSQSFLENEDTTLHGANAPQLHEPPSVTNPTPDEPSHPPTTATEPEGASHPPPPPTNSEFLQQVRDLRRTERRLDRREERQRQRELRRQERREARQSERDARQRVHWEARAAAAYPDSPAEQARYLRDQEQARNRRRAEGEGVTVAGMQAFRARTGRLPNAEDEEQILRERAALSARGGVAGRPVEEALAEEGRAQVIHARDAWDAWMERGGVDRALIERVRREKVADVKRQKEVALLEMETVLGRLADDRRRENKERFEKRGGGPVERLKIRLGQSFAVLEEEMLVAHHTHHDHTAPTEALLKTYRNSNRKASRLADRAAEVLTPPTVLGITAADKADIERVVAAVARAGAEEAMTLGALGSGVVTHEVVDGRMTIVHELDELRERNRMEVSRMVARFGAEDLWPAGRPAQMGIVVGDVAGASASAGVGDGNGDGDGEGGEREEWEERAWRRLRAGRTRRTRRTGRTGVVGDVRTGGPVGVDAEMVDGEGREEVEVEEGQGEEGQGQGEGESVEVPLDLGERYEEALEMTQTILRGPT